MTHFDRLTDIMARLRGEGGCPWDRKQTHKTLKPYLLEETYEVLEAIDHEDDQELKKELGDLLLQVVFHAQIADEDGRFNVDEVSEAIVSKLIHRHPHVFGNKKVEGADEVLVNWEQLKKSEGDAQPSEVSVLDGVPKHLPALMKARRVQEKASRVGFDWTHSQEVVQVIHDEVKEFLDAYREGEKSKMEEEMGDLLFSIVNLSRFLNICPEESLRKAVDKFMERFRYIEREFARRREELKGATLAQMDRLWEQAKRES